MSAEKEPRGRPAAEWSRGEPNDESERGESKRTAATSGTRRAPEDASPASPLRGDSSSKPALHADWPAPATVGEAKST